MTFKRNLIDVVPYSISQRVTPGPGRWSAAVVLLLLLFLLSGWNGNCCAHILSVSIAASPEGESEACCPVADVDEENSHHHGNQTHTHSSCAGNCAEGEDCAFCACTVEQTPGPDSRATVSTMRMVVTTPAMAVVYTTDNVYPGNRQNNAISRHRVASASVPAYLMNRVLLN